MNYERDMEIDPSALDVEWLGQPTLMAKYTKHSAEMKRQADMAKERLNLVQAELDSKIRTSPEEYGIAKVTENSLKAALLQQKEYQDATQEYIDASFEENVAKGVVQAVADRRSALENLVRLHGMQYFAGPNIPRDLDKEWESRIKQQSSDGKVRMTRKRRDAD